MPVSLQFISDKHKGDHRDTGGLNVSGCKLSGSSHTGTSSVDTLILGKIQCIYRTDVSMNLVTIKNTQG